MAMGHSDRVSVVVTGVGLVTPLGIGREAFAVAVADGRSGVRLFPELVGHGLPVEFGCPLVDFDPKALIRPRKALKVMCREIQTGFAAAQLAWQDAGLDTSTPEPERVGVVFGSEMLYGEWNELEAAVRRCDIQGDGIDVKRWGSVAMSEVFPLWMLKYLPNMTACHVAIAIDARGPNNTVTLDDCSGLSAIAEAARYIERGHADIVLAGASGTRVNAARSLWLNPLPVAHRREPLESTCQPWSFDCGGAIGGEGAAVLVLESLASAQRRGRTPLAQINGYGNYFVPAETGRRGSPHAVRAAATAACDAAGVTPGALGGCWGHGTGDHSMDMTAGIGLRSAGVDCPVTTLQQTIGHCGAACGLIDSAAAVLALQTMQLPHLPFITDIDPDCTLDVVRDQPRPFHAPHLLVVNQTVRGHACSLLVSAAS
jgi:3-oxoacyl-(acyl-carrier-protein) synthase